MYGLKVAMKDARSAAERMLVDITSLGTHCRLSEGSEVAFHQERLDMSCCGFLAQRAESIALHMFTKK